MTVHFNPTRWHCSRLTIRFLLGGQPYRTLRFLRVGPFIVKWEPADVR